MNINNIVLISTHSLLHCNCHFS